MIFQARGHNSRLYVRSRTAIRRLKRWTKIDRSSRCRQSHTIQTFLTHQFSTTSSKSRLSQLKCLVQMKTRLWNQAVISSRPPAANLSREKTRVIALTPNSQQDMPNKANLQSSKRIIRAHSVENPQLNITGAISRQNSAIFVSESQRESSNTLIAITSSASTIFDE